MEVKSEEKKLEIYQYRVGMLSGAIIYPFFGWISSHILKVSFDSLSSRAPVALYCAIVFFLSFTSKRFLKYIRFFVLFAACWLIHDFYGYFLQSNYHFYFCIGLTAIPFIVFNVLFYPIDAIFYFLFILCEGLFRIKDFNTVFVLVYFILMIMASTMYITVFRSRNKLFAMLKKNISEIQEKNNSLSRIGELAAQVAHDIRSPVAALKVVSETLTDVDPRKKQLIEKAAIRINGIADYLLSEYRTNLTSDLSNQKIARSEHINEVINEIILEKKVILDANINLNFSEVELVKVPNDLNLIEFKRVFSNILNNSIEALDKNEKKIQITLKQNEKNIFLKIQDNGKGIPEEFLEKIFKKGVSFSKAQGTGLGLAHAKEFLHSINGSIDIESQVNIGTKVTITLRK